MRTAVCPGSFDPVTRGHLDIFERAAKMFDQVIVAVFHNPGKKPMFSMDERVEMLEIATSHIPNIRVDSFSGLLHEYVRQQGSFIILRGLRALSDFEYEFQMAGMNRSMYPDVETLFMTPAEQYMFISATMVREIASLGGNAETFVHPLVAQRLLGKMTKRV